MAVRNKRGNLLASAARTATPSDVIIANNEGYTELDVVLNCTAVPGSAPSTTLTLFERTASGALVSLLVSAAIVATGVTRLKLTNALAASANAIAQQNVPSEVVARVTHGNANSMTYSVDYELYANPGNK